MRTTIAPSSAARLWHSARVAGDARRMAAMEARCPDVANRCVQCGKALKATTVVGPECEQAARRSGRGPLIDAALAIA